MTFVLRSYLKEAVKLLLKEWEYQCIAVLMHQSLIEHCHNDLVNSPKTKLNRKGDDCLSNLG